MLLKHTRIQYYAFTYVQMRLSCTAVVCAIVIVRMYNIMFSDK